MSNEAECSYFTRQLALQREVSEEMTSSLRASYLSKLHGRNADVKRSVSMHELLLASRSWSFEVKTEFLTTACWSVLTRELKEKKTGVS